MDTFRRTLKVVIAVNILLGLVLLIWPGLIADGYDAYAAVDRTWTRGLGLVLILLSLSFVPSAVLPLANRYLGLLAAAAQLVIGLFFLIAMVDLWWLLAAYAFIVSYLLFATFWRGTREHLMSKP